MTYRVTLIAQDGRAISVPNGAWIDVDIPELDAARMTNDSATELYLLPALKAAYARVRANIERARESPPDVIQ